MHPRMRTHAQDKASGATPIMAALSGGHLEVAKRLVRSSKKDKVCVRCRRFGSGEA